MVGKEASDGIVVGKWKDRREVLFLSTKHVLDMVPSGKVRSGTEKRKPAIIVEYNKGKQGVDISDQMASYFSPLRKTIRWYHKLVFEFILNTSVVNALILYRTLTGHTMQIKDFRMAITQHLLGMSTEEESDVSRNQQRLPLPRGPTSGSKRGHCLTVTQEKDKRNRKLRKRCQECYMKIAKKHGRSEAVLRVKKVVTFCGACNKWLCPECYSQTH